MPKPGIGATMAIPEVATLVDEKSSVGAFNIENLSVAYGNDVAIDDVTFVVHPQASTALIGPSGCGKSTVLRCLNRMNDEVQSARTGGVVKLDGENILDDNFDIVDLRMRVGQVFQHPNPFPMSIYDNIAYGPRIQGLASNKKELDEIVQTSLERAALLEEVKDNLDGHAFGLSGGQQQRLCIARALANDPEVILMDEPASALDPISTKQIEETIVKLKEEVTVVIVTHNMQQAQRVSDYTAFFLRESMESPSQLIEFDKTDVIFNDANDSRTTDYVNGQFG